MPKPMDDETSAKLSELRRAARGRADYMTREIQAAVNTGANVFDTESYREAYKAFAVLIGQIAEIIEKHR